MSAMSSGTTAKRSFSEPDVPPASVYNQCVRCGLCLPTCPTYVETLVETSSPRGRIALIKAVAEGRLDPQGPGFVHQMSECLDCRACEAVCPSGVAYGRLVEPARAQIERAAARRRGILRRIARDFALVLIDDLTLMRVAASLLRFYQRSGLQALVRRSGLLRATGLERLDAAAPHISEHFFVPEGQLWQTPVGPSKATVCLHTGCVMHVAFAEVHRATVRVLNRAGCDVVAPPSQGCCGAIAVHAGDMERGRALAKRNIVAFERSGADVYLVNAAGCGSTLKEYGLLFAGNGAWAERAAAFSSKVRDVTEFLDAIGLGPGLGPIEESVVYQDPCHLAHAQRITGAPRRLLAQIPRLVLKELDDGALCCGSAGLYNLTQPAMAQRLLRRKIERIVATEASVVATANPGCALHLENGLSQAGCRISVKHVLVLLDEAYAGAS
jgi:glycolate oxidase iron-sulfur subunit